MPRYDWDYYRTKYVTSDATLQDISEIPEAPALGTLKRYSTTQDWPGQRRAYKDQTATRTQNLASVTEAEVSARHVRIAKALQHKALERLRTLNVSELGPRDLLAFLKEATDIERKALGMETVRLRHLNKDPSEMTDDELVEALHEFGSRTADQGGGAAGSSAPRPARLGPN